MPRKVKHAPVATAAPYTLQTLPVKQILALDDIQPRVRLDTEAIEEYATLYSEAEGEEPLEPIDVFKIGGKHYVSDGFHRLEAATTAGRTELACHVYEGSQQEALRHGIFKNLKRGVKYSQRDLQRILELLLQDPVVSQRSDRELGRDLGLSHVTVGRARHRVAAEATLEEQWHAVPVTQTKEDARRQEQIATFLEVEPQVVASYDKIISKPLDKDSLISMVARNMTDRNESEAQAKEAVVQRMHHQIAQDEVAREQRKKDRPRKETPEERERREASDADRRAKWERQMRHDSLCHAVERFATLQDGIREGSYGGPCTLADMLATLRPVTRGTLLAQLDQAEEVLHVLRDALAEPRAVAAEA